MALTPLDLDPPGQHASASWNGHVQPLPPKGQLVVHPGGFPPPRVTEKKQVGGVSGCSCLREETRRSSAASLELFLIVSVNSRANVPAFLRSRGYIGSSLTKREWSIIRRVLYRQKARREKAIKRLAHRYLDRFGGIWTTRSPFLLFAIKSALAAGLSWEAASLLLGAEAGALAVVSAIIIVQTTNWQTVRKGIERVLGVLIGVSLAVLVVHFAGLNLATITLMIFGAQIIGMLVQNRGQYLATQIPISAALALVLGVSGGDYPLLRILGAVVGALVGTAVSLLLSPPIYVSRMRETLAELIIQLAGGMQELAHVLPTSLGERERRETYSHMLALEGQVHAAQQALSLALESTRLNPWARRARRLIIDYPDVLLTLDRIARQMRRIAYTMINEPEPSWTELVQKQEWVANYASLLEEVGSILEASATSLRLPATSAQNNLADGDLRSSIEHARQQLSYWQGQLVQDVKQQGAVQPLKADGSLSSVGVRLVIRGTMLTDLRRMLDEARDVIEMLSFPSLLAEASDGPGDIVPFRPKTGS